MLLSRAAWGALSHQAVSSRLEAPTVLDRFRGENAMLSTRLHTSPEIFGKLVIDSAT